MHPGALPKRNQTPPAWIAHGNRPRWMISAALLLLALVGCGGKKMNPVTGAVKVDGKDLESGAILFVPVDGKTPTAGGEIKAGHYSVQVPAGLMKVSISAPKEVGRKKIYPTPDSPEMPVMREALPARYNEQTELRFEVTPGKNEKDFLLESK